MRTLFIPYVEEALLGGYFLGNAAEDGRSDKASVVVGVNDVRTFDDDDANVPGIIGGKVTCVGGVDGFVATVVLGRTEL